ncbi:MAG: efflux transporter outer membrane subunit [Gammaproteobacteria bacterium]|nr:MAG: efflux transporter outer membrane subunit [Gammaproteobacteria bacterium]
MRAGRVVALGAAALLAAGCTVGPDYVRPDVEAPTAWRVDFEKAADVANTKWWEQFEDPALNGLIETALHENRDVRIAAARIEQFRGVLATVQAQGLPQVGYGGGVSRTQASREGFPAIPAPVDREFSLYEGALSAAWQVDLFGRVRRLSEAAQAQVYASEQGKRGVVLSLVAGVASSYITLRAFDRQLEIAEATAVNFRESLRIFELRFKAGIVSQTEVTQVRSQYLQARAAIPAIGQQIVVMENLISVLIGGNPQPIPRGRPIGEFIAPSIPADLPSSLLQRRPDILQAEQNLIAANASIGAARALYYPNISLTGLLGSVSTESSEFLTGSATAWSVGAELTGPIFTSGAIRGQVRSAEAQYQQALLAYQQIILNAFRETNDALAGTLNRAEEVELQMQRVEALREFLRLSQLKFEKGVAGYLEVLVAENERFAAELATIRLLADRYIQVVNVYQAMGGGWVDIAESMTQ